MTTPQQVLITAKAARYHTSDACPGYRQAVTKSEHLGRNVHAPRRCGGAA